MKNKLSASALLALAVASLLCSLPKTGLAAAGIAQFTFGEVQVQRSGANTPLVKGDAVESGDVLNTGPQGHTQVKFTDGGIMSLSPNSQLVIQRYSDNNDGAKDSFLVNFVRGGMRAITGLIGKRNRDNYKIQTSASTIGIRGSGFSSQYNPDGTVTVSGELDEIEVCTQAGCVGLGVGQSVVVQSNDTVPLRTSPQANLELPDLRQTITISGNNVNASGSASIVPAQAARVCSNPTANLNTMAASIISSTCPLTEGGVE